jgi:hypothetical protein
MAGAVATHTADTLPSPSSANGNQQPWDFSVPLGQEVGLAFFFFLFFFFL